MSRLTAGLDELEKAGEAFQAAPLLDKVSKLPRFLVLLFSLLSGLVHAVERQAMLIEKLERLSNGENRND